MKKELIIPPSRQKLYLPTVGLIVPVIVAFIGGRMTIQLPKWIPDSSMNAALADIDATTTMHAISAYTAGDSRATVVGNSLADVAMAAGDTVIADGDTSGRKITMAAKSGVTIDVTGTATHIALEDATNVDLVTTCTSQALTAAGTVNFPTWKHEIGDPT